MKAGMVAIVGRPNAGKSTLLNALAGEKVAIVSPVPQTTRHQIRAVFNDARGQIVFLDTPGVHKSEGAFERAMGAAIQGALSGADVVLHIVDVGEPPGFEESMVIDMLASGRTPVILALNKIDRGVVHLGLFLKAWEAKLGCALSAATERVMPLPISAMKGTNIDKLLEEIYKRLPEGPALYPEDVLTDFPRQLTIQDVVREKMLRVLRDEEAEHGTFKDDRVHHVVFRKRGKAWSAGIV
jgi:GTP-binding protein Era